MQMDGFKLPAAISSRMHLLLTMALAVLAAAPATAGSLERAKRIHDRLAGVAPSAGVLNQMQQAVSNNAGCGIALTGGCTPLGAAYLAMENPAFYNATLKNWATPWTNREDNKFAPLNDYSATVVGIVRDGVDYRQVLFGDIIYVPNNSYGTYSNSNNNAYAALEAADGNMGDSSVLQQRAQSSVTGLPTAATAGIATTRAAARAFFVDGTNRAMFRFTLKNHLCYDLEQVQDVTRPADRIRQDVSRSPGGDSRIFMNTCVGCHAGMDPLAQAFAYYNFSYDKNAADQDAAKDAGSLQYTPGVVQPKYLINSNHFPEGYVTPNDRWDNYWRSGPNTAIFGWSNTHNAATSSAHTVNGIYGDAGAKSMMEELANTEAFAVCSVKKVFKAVCLRDPANTDQSAFTTMLNNFKAGHDLKHTFAEAAVYCSGI